MDNSTETVIGYDRQNAPQVAQIPVQEVRHACRVRVCVSVVHDGTEY